MTPLLLVGALALGAPTESNWPGFRGDGSSATATKVPLKWAPNDGVAWRTELPGYGQSSPVVWNGRAFVTAVDGAEKDTILAAGVDLATGKVLWKQTLAGSQKGKNNPMMSRAGPSPVADARGVYCFYETGDAVAFDHDGKHLWHRSLAKDYGEFKNNHGIGSSLAQHGPAVFVLVDHAGPSYLLALDKATGKELWKAERPSGTGWTSPVVAELKGKPTVLVSGGGKLTAYDAATGKQLAELDGLTGNNIPSPTPAGAVILVGAAENRMKPDAAASAKSNCAVRFTEKGFETVWGAKKAISHHASPVACGGFAYFVTKTGFVHCLDLKTGEEKFAERLDDQCWATPVVAGEHVFFFGKSGVTTVLKAGPEFDVVATNRLWSKDDYAARLEAAKKKAAETMPKPPEGKGPAGGAPIPKADLDAIRYSAVGDVVYGVAATDGAFLVRTGTELVCVRAAKR